MPSCPAQSTTGSIKPEPPSAQTAAAHQITRETRAAQGLTATITDPVVIERIAVLVSGRAVRS